MIPPLPLEMLPTLHFMPRDLKPGVYVQREHFGASFVSTLSLDEAELLLAQVRDLGRRLERAIVDADARFSARP